MSRVIKNNDGVAIVEGTPAASLVKDANKFFATKPITRMAGEAVRPQTIKSIAQSGKIDTRRGNRSEEVRAASALTKPMMEMIDGRNTVVGYMLDGETTMFNEDQMNLSPVEKADLLPQRVTAAMQGGDPSARPVPDTKPQVRRPARSTGKEPEVVLDTLMGRRPTVGTGKEPEVVLDTLMGNRKKEPEVVLDTFMGRRPAMDRKKEPEVVLDTLKGGSKSSEPAIKTNVEEETPQKKEMKREEALDKTKEFKRQRAAERSADEQESTKGKFISTLRR